MIATFGPQAVCLGVTGHARQAILRVDHKIDRNQSFTVSECSCQLEKTRGSDFGWQLLQRFASYARQRTGHTGWRSLRIDKSSIESSRFFNELQEF
jgi:hypothetical protein